MRLRRCGGTLIWHSPWLIDNSWLTPISSEYTTGL